MKRIWGILPTLGLVMGAGVTFAAEAQPDPLSKYYGEQLCIREPNTYQCIMVGRGDTWEKLFPDARERDIVRRVNRRNMNLYAGLWLAVPRDLKDKTLMDFAPCPYKIPAPGEKFIRVDLKSLAFCAYEPEGALVHWGPISAGKHWCPDVHRPCSTPTGLYRIFKRDGINCISNKYPVEEAGGAKMPYCMFFFRGYALHGSTLPGSHDSHGCVRLFFKDAYWLNSGFVNPGYTMVEVVDEY